MLLEIKILTALFLFSPLLVSGGGGALPRDNHSLSLFLFFFFCTVAHNRNRTRATLIMLQGRRGRNRLVLGLMIINLYFYPIKFDINIILQVFPLARNRDDRMDVPLFWPLLCVDQAHIQSFHQVSAEISFVKFIDLILGAVHILRQPKSGVPGPPSPLRQQ